MTDMSLLHTELPTQKPRISFAIDSELKQALEIQAAKESRTVSNLIIVAVKEYLESCAKGKKS
ncbi:MAG: CopG family transcriptional regulator [Pseudanabaena sp. CAN_BIN31]|nr:CopG family transcriptional regulator [Pseudanabaena sp. CAN_BIN31]